MPKFWRWLEVRAVFGRGVPVLVVAKCAEPADCRGDAVCTESPSEGAGVYFGRGTCEWRIVVGESERGLEVEFEVDLGSSPVYLRRTAAS
jgi:hypothetical protein